MVLLAEGVLRQEEEEDMEEVVEVSPVDLEVEEVVDIFQIRGQLRELLRGPLPLEIYLRQQIRQMQIILDQ